MEARAVIPIEKLNDEERTFGGWAYVAVDKHGQAVVDHSGDTIDTPEAWDALRKAFIRFAVEVRKGDDMHQNFEVADLVEMFIVDKDKRDMLGLPEGYLPGAGVWVSFKAAESPEGEALWAAIKSGERKALSIVGTGVREPIDG